MSAIRFGLLIVPLLMATAAQATVIATYDFSNTGNMAGLTLGTINETGTAVLEDSADGQGVLTIDRSGTYYTTALGGAYRVTSRLVYVGTLANGLLTITSGQNTNLICEADTASCPIDTHPVLQLGVTTILTNTPSIGDGGGLPLTDTPGGLVYDTYFYVTDVTEHLASRVWMWDHLVMFENRMTFTNTTPAVPIPAAAWLFGSGLLGLFGVVRRKPQS